MLEVTTRRCVWMVAMTVAAFSSVTCVVGDEDPLSTEEQGVAVTWTNTLGVTATGNDLIKTAPPPPQWGNAGAVSVQTINSDGFVEFTTSESNLGKSAGLSVGDTNWHQTDIDYSIHLSANGSLSIIEAGTVIGTFGPYLAGQVMRIESVEREVRYYRDGAALHTSTRVPQFPALVDTALFHTNATIENVDLSDYRFRNTVGVTVSGSNLTKTGTVSQWGDSGAISVRTIKAGEGYVEFSTAENNRGKILGLSLVDTNQSYNSIRYGLLLGANQVVQVYETAVLRGSFGTYTAGQVFRVEIVNNQVRYTRNGVVFYTSTIAPSYPLFADAALFSPNATLTNIVVEDTFFTSVVGAEAIGNKLYGSGATGWGNSGAVSLAIIGNGDGSVEFTTSETNRGKAMGLNSVDANQNYTDIDYAIVLGSSGSGAVHENGVLRVSFGSYLPTDVFRVELTGGVVTYRRNGVLLYTSTIAPTYPLRADAAMYNAGATIKNVVVVGSPLQIVPRDPVSGYAVPLTQSDWNAVFAAAGVTPKTVGQSWSLQDAAGNAVATIGSALVASTGALALDYQQAVAGWDRDAIVLSPDGAAEWLKQVRTVGPDATTTSVLSFVYAGVDPLTVVPSTRRVLVISGSTGTEVLLGMTNDGSYRLVCAGAATLGASTSAAGPVRPIVLQYDRTAGSVRAYTDQEIISGTYSTAITSSTKGFGTADGSGTSAVQRNLLAATFSGVNAEWTEAEMRAVYNVLIDATVPW